MAFTYIRVTRTYELATDVPATGSVRFRPIDRMVNGLTVVSSPVTATLDGSGTIDVRLAATTDSATRPIGVTYEVREQITGQAIVTYYVSIPHNAPGATVDLATLSVISPVDAGAFDLVDAGDYDDTSPPSAGEAIVWNATTSKWEPGASGAAGVNTINGEFPDGAGNIVLSPSDVGAQPADADLTGLGGLGDGYPKRAAGSWAAQTAAQLATDLGVQNTTPVTLTASGGTITPNASSGWYFQHTATANVALANPTGGTAGQLIVVDVLASGADRVVTLPAGTSPGTVTVTSGTWRPFEMRNHAGTWQTLDYLSAASAGAPADGSVTNIKVATNAAISADKLVDGATNKLMTAAERTKVAGLAAIATSGSAADLTAGTVPTARLGSGTASSTTFLRGDQTWAAGGAGIDQTIVDAKGDIIAATAADTVARLAVGANGQVLTANSATTTGLQWTTPSAAAGTVGWINVKSSPYNATGNGTTNDTTAIQTAYNALPAAGGVLYFPPGTYLLGRLNMNKANTTIIGDGATLKLPTNSPTYIVYVTAANCTIGPNLILDGNRANQADGFGAGHFDFDNVRVEDTSNFTIHGCRVINSWGGGINLYRTSDSLIFRNYLDNHYDNGVIIAEAGADRNVISHNVVNNTFVQNGIFITASPGSITTTDFVYDNVVTHNYITAAGDTAIETGIHSVRTVISHNYVEVINNPALLARDAVSFWMFENQVLIQNAAGVDGIAVVGQTEPDTWNTSGLIERNHVYGFPGGRSGIFLSQDGCRVIDNTVEQTTTAITSATTTQAGYPGWGIRTDGRNKTIIRGNRITGFGIGIDLNYPASAMSVTENVISDNIIDRCWQGISLFALAFTNSRIERNRINRFGNAAINGSGATGGGSTIAINNDLYPLGYPGSYVRYPLAGTDGFLVEGGTTATRPTAAAAGQGWQYYNTTTNLPNWSNGTIWRNAAGTTV